MSLCYFFTDKLSNVAHLIYHRVHLTSLESLVGGTCLVGRWLEAYSGILTVAGYYRGYSSRLRDGIISFELSGRELLNLIVLLIVRIRA